MSEPMRHIVITRLVVVYDDGVTDIRHDAKGFNLGTSLTDRFREDLGISAEEEAFHIEALKKACTKRGFADSLTTWSVEDRKV